MIITIRYLERTCLELVPFQKVVHKYLKGVQKDVVITFDMRISGMAQYTYCNRTKRHLIKISPKHNKFDDDLGLALEQALPEDTQCMNYLSSFLHEVRHTRQMEEKGAAAFYAKKYNHNKFIRDKDFAADFSECELDARAYENKNLMEAAEYYNKIKRGLLL